MTKTKLGDGLMCGSPVRIEYDEKAKRGVVHMRPGCCVDMRATLDLFAAIDPAVRQIDTIAGKVPDTSYRRFTSGWASKAPHEDRYYR